MTVTRHGLKLPATYAAYSGGVKAGVLAGATYPADELTNAKSGAKYPDARAGLPVASIAAALEYGDGQNHPRPFMQQTAAEQHQTWSDTIVKLLVGGVPARDALRTVGQIMKEDIRDTINAWPADNAESWAEIKGFNKGLIQTGHLSNSIESAIYAKGE